MKNIEKLEDLDGADLLTLLRAYIGLHAIVLTHKGDWIVRYCLPEEIKKVNFPVLLTWWRELQASLIMFWVLYKRAMEELRDKFLSYTIEYEFKAPANFLERYRWYYPELVKLAMQYSLIRSRNLNTVGNIAKLNPGLEHQGGVIQGGEFILVVDGEHGEEIPVADFALSEKLPCCCNTNLTINQRPLIPQSDFVVVTLRKKEAGGYVSITRKINVMDNDFNSRNNDNQYLYVDVIDTDTEIGGHADEDGALNGVINYSHDNPIPFASDKFYYHLKHSENENYDEVGVVVVHFWPEEKGLGQIKGLVKTKTKIGEEPVPDAQVLLNEQGVSMTTLGDGKFQFEELPAGIHTLYVSKDGYRTEIRTVELEENEEDYVEIELQELLPGTILGWTRLVYEYQTLPGAVVEYTYPLPGITITIQNSDIEPQVTGPNGQFRFDNIISRKYVLETFYETPEVSLKPKYKTIVLGESEMQEVYFKFSIDDIIQNQVANNLHEIAVDETNYAAAVAKYISNNYQLIQLKGSVSADAQPVYEKVKVFTNDDIINPQISNADKQKRYDLLVQNIEESMQAAPAEEKATYRTILELASKAYLDVMAVSGGGITDDTKVAVNSVTANIKSAGIDVATFNTSWSESISFSGKAGSLAKEISGLIK
jgi:hypothetical protein